MGEGLSKKVHGRRSVREGLLEKRDVVEKEGCGRKSGFDTI